MEYISCMLCCGWILLLAGAVIMLHGRALPDQHQLWFFGLNIVCRVLLPGYVGGTGVAVDVE